MMMLLAVFIINSVHVNSHHVSRRTVEWRLCCRNISVQFWRVHEVNSDDVQIEKNACHRTDWSHIHNVSSAIALMNQTRDEARFCWWNPSSGAGGWLLLNALPLVPLATEAMTDDDQREAWSIILQARALFLCHLHFTIRLNVWTHFI